MIRIGVKVEGEEKRFNIRHISRCNGLMLKAIRITSKNMMQYATSMLFPKFGRESFDRSPESPQLSFCFPLSPEELLIYDFFQPL